MLRVMYRPLEGEVFPAQSVLGVLGVSCAPVAHDAETTSCGALIDARGSAGRPLRNLSFTGLRFADVASGYPTYPSRDADASATYQEWSYTVAVLIQWAARPRLERCQFAATSFGVMLTSATDGLINRCSFTDSAGVAASLFRSPGAMLNDSHIRGFGTEFLGAAGVNVLTLGNIGT